VSGSNDGHFPFAFLKECYEEEKMEWPIKSLDLYIGALFYWNPKQFPIIVFSPYYTL